MLLALDTATRMAGVALYDPQQATVRGELLWTAGMHAVTQLMQAVDDLLRLASVSRAELTGIAVTNGPGSFNGVRIGVTSAKGLAWALGIPLAGIGTLEAAAYQHADLSRTSGLALLPVVDAGRGQVAVALYKQERPHDHSGWAELEAPRVVPPDVLAGELSGKQVYVCGEVNDHLAEMLAAMGVPVAGISERIRRPGALAVLAAQHIRAGNGDDPADLVPNYLQRPPINPNNPASRRR